MITEVLLEPGSAQLWVSTGDHTARLDLTPLLAAEPTHLLRLPRIWRRVAVTPEGNGLQWPGLTLGWNALRPLTVDRMPAAERYRPLLPYLRAHEPALHAPAPVSPLRVERLLSLRPTQLSRAAQTLMVPAPLAEQRLYDIGVLLTEAVGTTAVLPLLRRPWPVARRLNNSRLQSVEDCLVGGRPDLVERALMRLTLEAL